MVTTWLPAAPKAQGFLVHSQGSGSFASQEVHSDVPTQSQGPGECPTLPGLDLDDLLSLKQSLCKGQQPYPDWLRPVSTQA